jgi:hypothetical protein
MSLMSDLAFLEASPESPLRYIKLYLGELLWKPERSSEGRSRKMQAARLESLGEDMAVSGNTT